MGKKIGNYELGRTIGSGNYAKVKVGTNTETQESFAIKIVDKELLAKEHMEEQLRREIAILKVLKHPNIVMMKEVLQTSKHIYLVLELVTGGELFEKIAVEKKFEENVARKYFQQLVLGVRYCHRQGIAHRDLKPENLLLDDKGNLKISDFGLANLQRGGPNGQPTMMQTVCGTPNYVAPEVLKERGYNGVMADVWSCGIILFVMLAGYLPFDDTNINGLFNKIERGEYRMARNFSDGARDLISKMIVVDPGRRFTMDNVVAHPWFQVDFDNRLLQDDIIEPSNEQLTNAVKNAEEEAQSPVCPHAGSGPDAFAVIFRLLGGEFSPLVLTTQGIAHGVTRKVFLYRSPTSEALQDLHKTLETMRANPKITEERAEVKGFLNASKGLLTFVIEAIPTIVSTLCVVEVRRGRGDVKDFQDFVRVLSTNLGVKVASQDLL